MMRLPPAQEATGDKADGPFLPDDPTNEVGAERAPTAKAPYVVPTIEYAVDDRPLPALAAKMAPIEAPKWKPLAAASGPTEEDMKRIFRMYDKNNDGTIDAEELGTLMRGAFGLCPSEEDLFGLIFDHSPPFFNEGKIGFEQFKDMMVEFKKEPPTKDQFDEAFKMFDKDKDGTISIDEFSAIIMSVGEQVSQEDIEYLFSSADVDHNGKLSHDEFVNFMMT